jgi:hypothetical protein
MEDIKVGDKFLIEVEVMSITGEICHIEHDNIYFYASDYTNVACTKRELLKHAKKIGGDDGE